MDKNELLVKARKAKGPGAANAAEKILLFNQLLEQLEQCCIHRTDSKAARQRLRMKVREFRSAVGEIAVELSDWNIGARAKAKVSQHLRDISDELIKLDKENVP